MEAAIEQSVRLRAQGKYSEAVAAIEDALASFDAETRLVALLEAFYAARDGKLESKAKDLARRIYAIEPDTPSIKGFL